MRIFFLQKYHTDIDVPTADTHLSWLMLDRAA